MTKSSVTPPKKPRNLPAPNPVTRRLHRRQARLEILLPFTFGILGLAWLILFLVDAEVGSLAVWAAIAVIVLAVPALVVLMVALVLSIAMVIATTQALKILPPYTRQAQQAVELISERIRSGADISVRPILAIKSYLAVVESLLGGRNGKG